MSVGQTKLFVLSVCRFVNDTHVENLHFVLFCPNKKLTHLNLCFEPVSPTSLVTDKVWSIVHPFKVAYDLKKKGKQNKNRYSLQRTNLGAMWTMYRQKIYRGAKTEQITRGRFGYLGLYKLIPASI